MFSLMVPAAVYFFYFMIQCQSHPGGSVDRFRDPAPISRVQVMIPQDLVEYDVDVELRFTFRIDEGLQCEWTLLISQIGRLVPWLVPAGNQPLAWIVSLPAGPSA